MHHRSSHQKVLTLSPKSVAIAPPKECPTILTSYPWHSDPGPNNDARNPDISDGEASVRCWYISTKYKLNEMCTSKTSVSLACHVLVSWHSISWHPCHEISCDWTLITWKPMLTCGCTSFYKHMKFMIYKNDICLL